MTAPLLSCRQLTRRFGGVVAVQDADIDVAQGAIVGLIGPNGAGKTTMFTMISGFIPPDKGAVIFKG
ncbi:MAG: ATP-binding cassette domain-containing protein, partial [Beijerinckiaceae bacterium]